MDAQPQTTTLETSEPGTMEPGTMEPGMAPETVAPETAEPRAMASPAPGKTAGAVASRATLADLARAMAAYDGPRVRVSGTVDEAMGAQRWVRGLSDYASLGDQLQIQHHDGPALAEIVRMDRERVVATLYEPRRAAFLGANAGLAGTFALKVHDGWLGRSVDALGQPIDGKGPLPRGPRRSVDADPPAALSRRPLDRAMRTGVRVIDIFAPLVEGQRVGLFAGSGVGKSTLLGMIAAASSFDVVVAALVGERGREVNDMLEGPLKAQRDRTVAVVSTGDETAMMRRRAPLTAMTIAEHFRDRGKRVLLLLDSVTRAAHAMRDVALAAGEAPVARGFPPSVFAELTRLVERAGRSDGEGSITAALAVLVDGDDFDEPVADALRGTLDGHIILSRALAEAGRFPPVDPLASLSRLAPNASASEELELARQLRRLISLYEETRDLRLLGAKAGTDPELDKAVALVPQIYEALVQTPSAAPSTDAFAELAAVLAGRREGGKESSAPA